MVDGQRCATRCLHTAASRNARTAEAVATAGLASRAARKPAPAVLLGAVILYSIIVHAAAARSKIAPGSQQTLVNQTVAAQHGPGGTNSNFVQKPRPRARTKTAFSQAQLVHLLKQSKPRPLRLRFDYTGLQNTSSQLTKQQVYDIQHRFGPATAAILTSFLQVRIPQQGPLTGPVQDYAIKYCEPEIVRAVNHGVNDTDTLLAVTTSRNCTSKMFAWASSCDWDLVTNRPTLGTLVVCPGFFNQTEGEQLATMLHEVIHALGFSSSWFEYWYDQDTGEPYKQVFELAAGVNEPAYLVTPRAKAYAQEYFGCPSLPGAPLDAASMSHWNHRGIALDLMIPHVVDTLQPSRLTPFTLKALEDTGWYVANYAVAEEPEHGRGAGCSFLLDSCAAYKASDLYSNYVCAPEEYNLDACTPDFRGIAYCDYGYGGCLAPVVDPTDQPDYPLLDCTNADSKYCTWLVKCNCSKCPGLVRHHLSRSRCSSILVSLNKCLTRPLAVLHSWHQDFCKCAWCATVTAR
eukprot:GHUV01012620.1.p1 GENE.GHUV01012620.1~~GHUV01012620.1.p1  ORF type:complete len:518 (+),score=57.56 GHUV01012620.1:562-2115(+)